MAARKRKTATVPPQAVPKPVDPTGRADIALTRLLGLAVRTFVPDPLIVTALEQAGPLIQIGMTALAGPKTDLGKKSMLAVAAIRTVKAQLDAAEAAGVRI